MKNISSLSGAAIALMIVAAPLLASAHERRVYQIGNKDYTLVVGFVNEPVTVDDKAGVYLSVMLGNDAPTMNSDGHMDGPPAATEPDVLHSVGDFADERVAARRPLEGGEIPRGVGAR